MATLAARSLILLVSVVTAVVGLLVATPASGSSHQVATVGWKQVSAGSSHTCGIRTDGRLYCWGFNESGQLGDGTTAPRHVPTQVAGARTDWAAVSAGGLHTCARRTSGRLFCWGFDAQGALGNGAAGGSLVPSQVAGSRTDWKGVTTGFEHTCALRASRRLFCWGDNAYGQLGDGTDDDRVAPKQVAGAWTNWTQVSAGSGHTCGRRASGRLYCWGEGEDGQLGDGGVSDRVRPTQVSGHRTDWASAAAGYYHSCGRRTTGRLFCWGDNPSGELGVGAVGGGERLTPTQVAGSRTDWVAVSSTSEHACARRSSGRLFCWGRNGGGQVGNGFNADTGSPTEVSGGSTQWRGFSAGGAHTCAVTSAGRAYCWGSNDNGQLGDNKSSPVRLVPHEVVSP